MSPASFMQTFLPHTGFHESASCLDRARLGKQRVEVLQLLTALSMKAEGIKSGWQNHPACLMWVGHRYALAAYGIAVCDEWISRGYKDTLRPRLQSILKELESIGESLENPAWLGVHEFHASHRARLLMKDPEHYGKFGWVEEPCGPEGYWWPTKNGY